MYRKIVLTLTLAFGLALTSSLALAQMPAAPAALPAEMTEALAKEKPLAQADIDTYLKMLPKMGPALTDPAAMAKLYEGAGLTETRATYISTKIGLAMSMAAGTTAQQLDMNQIPEVLRPTDQEIELVKKNNDALQKATMEMVTNMQKAQ